LELRPERGSLNHGGRVPKALLWSALVLAVITGRVHASETIAPADLLKVLRAKDAQFDNVKLDYVTSGQTRTEPFPAWKFPGLAKKHGWEHEKPEVIPFRYSENLIVRGPNVTLVRNLDPAVQPKGTRSRMVPFQKWSNTDGLSREITRNSDSGRGHAIMEIRAGGLPVDIAQESAMAIEFAHGFGFGKRIKHIDRIQREGSRLRVEGSIQIWWEDQSRFRLVLDDRYLVREAYIESNVKGNHTAFEVKTEGTATSSDLEFAKTGSFKRIALGRQVDGKLSSKPSVQKEFQTEFRGIQTNLSDDVYKELVAMNPEPGTQVFDYIADKTYIVGEEEKWWPIRPPPPDVPKGH